MTDEKLLDLWRSMPTPEGWTMNDLIVQYGREIERQLSAHATHAAPRSFPNRRWVEDAIKAAENPQGMRLNDGKERVTLPGGTLRIMLRLIDAAAQPAVPEGLEALTEAERIAYERFNKPEWSERSHFRLRVALAVSQETVTRCGAKIENLQDRVAAHERAISQIRAAISTDSCDGNSTYAAGVNAAVARHTESIDTILREARISIGKGEKQNG